MRSPARWAAIVGESFVLAAGSFRAQPLRSALAVVGVVIGIVTVVTVTLLLTGLRGQIALLFRELGTDNVFAYHRSGDPYAPATEEEAQRQPLDPAFAREMERLGRHIREVAVQVIVPPVVNGRALVARAGGNESDTALLEAASPGFFGVTGAQFASGRPFTEVESRSAARVAVLGSNVARALFRGPAVGQSFRLAGESWYVVGVTAPRRGSFFGENRQDNVISVPVGTVRRLFPGADATIFYLRARPGERDLARAEGEFILRQLRGLEPGEPNDFNLSTADQIIGQFDRLAAAVGLVTVALAGISLLIGGIGIANVMIISVTERTREIGLRRAVGARRHELLRQFLLESALLSLAGGVIGTAISLGLGGLLALALPGFPVAPPLPVIGGGLAAALVTGVVAGYWPARRAAALEPAEALRYE